MGEMSLAEKFRISSPKEIKPDHWVLVIEHQQDLRLIMTHHLNKLGYRNVKQLHNGYDALEYIKETDQPISVILCDAESPVIDAISLLTELRDDPACTRPPFVIMMDNPSKEKIMLALENGVDEVMVKPFTLNDILPKIQSTFRKFHNPKNPEKVYELAKQLYRHEKLDDASKVYHLIAKDAHNSARPLVGLARIAIKRNDFDEALTFLAEAESRNPNFVHLYATRGAVYMARGDQDQAIQAYMKAIELSPLNPTRYEDAACPLFENKRFQEGVDILSLALQHELSFPSLHRYLSEGYFALKDFSKAVKHIRTALVMEPDNVIYLNQLGISLKESQELEEAMKVYNSIIKLDNDNKAAYYNKAILQHTMGALDDAIKTLERALKKFPSFEPAQRKLKEYQSEQSAA